MKWKELDYQTRRKALEAAFRLYDAMRQYAEGVIDGRRPDGPALCVWGTIPPPQNWRYCVDSEQARIVGEIADKLNPTKKEAVVPLALDRWRLIQGDFIKAMEAIPANRNEAIPQAIRRRAVYVAGGCWWGVGIAEAELCAEVLAEEGENPRAMFQQLILRMDGLDSNVIKLQAATERTGGTIEAKVDALREDVQEEREGWKDKLEEERKRRAELAVKMVGLKESNPRLWDFVEAWIAGGTQEEVVARYNERHGTAHKQPWVAKQLQTLRDIYPAMTLDPQGGGRTHNRRRGWGGRGWNRQDEDAEE